MIVLGSVAVMMASTDALAGHAGESTLPPVMPHEILAAMTVLAVIGIALVVIGLIIIKLLVSIERHVRKPQ